MYADAHGDIITIVTRKSDQQQGAWILTRDIRNRFPNSRAAISAYDQQRAHHHNKDPKAECLLTHTRRVSLIRIPRHRGIRRCIITTSPTCRECGISRKGRNRTPSTLPRHLEHNIREHSHPRHRGTISGVGRLLHNTKRRGGTSRRTINSGA